MFDKNSIISKNNPQSTTCPVCGDNLASLLCHMTCSPDQSHSLEVLDPLDDWDDSVVTALRLERGSRSVHLEVQLH